MSRDSGEVTRLTDEVGELLGGVTFLIFGAVLLGPALGELTWRVVLYALISLTLVRMLPVAIAMLGHTRAHRQSRSSVGSDYVVWRRSSSR